MLSLPLAINCIIDHSYNFDRNCDSEQINHNSNSLQINHNYNLQQISRNYNLQQINRNSNFDRNIIDLFNHISNFGFINRVIRICTVICLVKCEVQEYIPIVNIVSANIFFIIGGNLYIYAPIAYIFHISETNVVYLSQFKFFYKPYCIVF